MFTFEWDDQKAASSLQKHGVPFDEVVSAFGDPLALTFRTQSTQRMRNEVGPMESQTRGGFWELYTRSVAIAFESSAQNVVVLQPEIQKVFPTSSSERLADLGFAAVTPVSTLRSIAQLFGSSKPRCRIYLMEFPENQFYIGQAQPGLRL